MADFLNSSSNKESIFAYIDECGAYGFNFDKPQNSPLFIITAIIVKDSDVSVVEECVAKISNGSGTAVLSSSLERTSTGRELLPIFTQSSLKLGFVRIYTYPASLLLFIKQVRFLSHKTIVQESYNTQLFY